MHIVVCVKQTPSSDNIKVDPQTGCLIRTGVESSINPFDEFAVEEAVRLKEKFGPGTTVSAVTMGPLQAETVLREAIARGCDAGFHVTDRAFAGSDTWATSYALSNAIKKVAEVKGKVDLVICGKQTNDSDTGHIGPQIATWLDWPNVAFVRKVESMDNASIQVERLMEDGYDILKMPLPAVISVIKEINTPRIASLKGRIAAKKAVLTVWSAQDIGCDTQKLGVKGSPTSVVKCFTPTVNVNSLKIDGATAKEKAANLVKILRERKLV